MLKFAFMLAVVVASTPQPPKSTSSKPTISTQPPQKNCSTVICDGGTTPKKASTCQSNCTKDKCCETATTATHNQCKSLSEEDCRNDKQGCKLDQYNKCELPLKERCKVFTDKKQCGTLKGCYWKRGKCSHASAISTFSTFMIIIALW